jgi:hypothetical protein
MDDGKAQAILRGIGEGGKLEVVLLHGAFLWAGGGLDQVHTDCHAYSGPPKQGDSLVGRLVEPPNPDHICFKIHAGTTNPQGLLEISVYYQHVHSIYPLRRAPPKGRPAAPSDPNNTAGHAD